MRDLVVQGLGLVEALHFGHDHVGLGRFGMGDVDGEFFAVVDVVELFGQHFGGEVQAAVGEVALAVAEGCFYDQYAYVECVDALPERGRRRR
jgi:hypothetical protein